MFVICIATSIEGCTPKGVNSYPVNTTVWVSLTLVLLSSTRAALATSGPFQGRAGGLIACDGERARRTKKKMESDGGASTRASTRATAARSAALLRPLRSAPLAERRRSSTRPGGRRGRRRPQQGAEAKGAARQAPRPGAARRRARRAKPSWPRSSAVPGSRRSGHGV